MLASKRVKSETNSASFNQNNKNSSHELKFIAELGRSLLFTVHLKKVALRVAEAIRTEIGAHVCAVAVELKQIGIVSSVFTRESSETKSDFLQKQRFDKWLEFMPSQIPFLKENKEEFFLEGDFHNFEYVSPVHIDGEVKGAMIVGFKRRKTARMQ